MGGMTEPRPPGKAPFHLRETTPATQHLYERERQELARLYREQCELERAKKK